MVAKHVQFNTERFHAWNSWKPKHLVLLVNFESLPLPLSGPLLKLAPKLSGSLLKLVSLISSPLLQLVASSCDPPLRLCTGYSITHFPYLGTKFRPFISFDYHGICKQKRNVQIHVLSHYIVFPSST